MLKMDKNIVYHTMSDEYMLFLKNVQEIAGHDDTLPYSADVFVQVKSTGIIYLVGKASNDGWGGPTNFWKDEAHAEIIKKLEELAGTYHWNLGSKLYPLTLCDIIDCMAIAKICYGCNEVKRENIVS